MNDNLNYQRVEKAIEYISKNFRQQPDLEEIAKEVNLSPFHFQKIFTEWAGVSPKKFLQYLNLNYLKEKLNDSENILEVAEMAGLSSQSRVYDLFISLEAVTPGEFKTAGIGMTINYGYHVTPFGDCFIAVSERGICAMTFINELTKETEFNVFSEKWKNADLKEDNIYTSNYINKIFFNNFNDKKDSNKLTLLVKGTNFQIKVWEALIKIPSGSLTTYEKIAWSIENPKAVRAVGTAIGSNPIAYMIPCHRVIRKEGKIGDYRWGSSRKKALIGWELSRENN